MKITELIRRIVLCKTLGVQADAQKEYRLSRVYPPPSLKYTPNKLRLGLLAIRISNKMIAQHVFKTA